MRDALLLYKLSKALHTECLITIIPCYVISNKFPRLLAEREIIANAFCLPAMSWKGCNPNPSVKLQINTDTPSCFHIKLQKLSA